MQGNRTCGIDHRPTEQFLDRLAAVCGIDPPREHGLDVVRTIEAMHSGDVKVFVGLSGNFALATPDTAYTCEALRRCELTVQVSTKLNRSHIVHGKQALILPCLARSEKDHQRGRLQGTTVEDSMAMVHMSVGMKRPASGQLLSEPAIIAGMAQATLPRSKTPWQDYVDDYDRICDTMARVLDGFEDFNRRARRPLGFRIRQPARELVFLTGSGRAEFSTAPVPDTVLPTGRLTLSTMRSHDDMRDRRLAEFDLVDITSIGKDGSRRTVHGYRAIAYDIPQGNAAGYMPELNVLCAIGDFSAQSDQPLTKHLVVEITPSVVDT